MEKATTNHLSQPYLCLLGSIGSDWRAAAQKFCSARGIAAVHTLDSAWDTINDANGDARQAQIDALVAEQQRIIAGASAVYFHIEASDAHGNPLAAHAARCELGYLTGSKRVCFVTIDPKVIGRNYLRAQLKNHAHMQVFASPQAALEAACTYVLAKHPAQPSKAD